MTGRFAPTAVIPTFGESGFARDEAALDHVIESGTSMKLQVKSESESTCCIKLSDRSIDFPQSPSELRCHADAWRQRRILATATHRQRAINSASPSERNKSKRKTGHVALSLEAPLIQAEIWRSHNGRCDGCIAVQAEAAARHGASREEIAEALGVATAVNAGAALVYSTRVLDAYEQVREASGTS
jgi:AhpD family alkylhydroperoxidase